MIVPNVKIAGDFDFNGVKIGRDCNLSGGEFGKAVNLVATKVGRNFSLYQAAMRDYCNIIGLNVEEQVNLATAQGPRYFTVTPEQAPDIQILAPGIPLVYQHALAEKKGKKTQPKIK